ncbi:hypothetical protein RFI_20409 [Reticulomyxa filosa]|uniref:Uncharacterized protein n=1 Tax=Reticulomyxa filosa TaxID=46433 RepID=X6MU29_RETFI|nr:hypothetical protein RFI_20409 [Reticulomyxa filosa]|eukprot:ETO16927.1 hypothetical protein RFI_20409 [Reticulomyxa filosa]
MGGRGKNFCIGGGYGTDDGKYFVEKNLLWRWRKRRIFMSCFALGGSGGIIELVSKQQLINCGSIQCRKWNKKWKCGMILIELQCQQNINNLAQTIGMITCDKELSLTLHLFNKKLKSKIFKNYTFVDRKKNYDWILFLHEEVNHIFNVSFQGQLSLHSTVLFFKRLIFQVNLQMFICVHF